jgi:hypothetical protein
MYQGTDGYCYPATNLTNNGTEANNQLAFAEYFLGVSDEKYGLQTGEKTFNLNQMKSPSVSICTAGRFEFPCPAQTVTPGKAMGIYAVSGAAIADAQKVDALAGGAALAQSIGYVSTTAGNIEEGTSVTKTRVVIEIQGARILGTTPVAGSYSGTSGQ